MNEGKCWEAFQFISSRKLNNLIVLIDENKRQLDGFTRDVLYPFDIAEKMRAFGFEVRRVKGSAETAISRAIDAMKQVKERAVCIVLDTIKGQGVPYFEEMVDNHSVKFTEADNRVLDEAIAALEITTREAAP